MSVRLKLVTLVLFVALLPVRISAYTSLGAHQRALELNLARLHQAIATREAQRVDARLKNLENNLQRLVTSTLPWDELTPDERQAALWLVYRADEDIVVALLTDANRSLLAPPAYLTEANALEEPGHLSEPSAVVAATLRHLSKISTGTPEIHFGEPFLISAQQDPIVPLNVPVPQHKAGPTLSLTVGLSMRGVCRAEVKPDGIELLLVDEEQRRVCGTIQVGALTPLNTQHESTIEANTMASRYRDRQGRELLSSAADLRHGWRVFAEQPVAVAYATSDGMRRQAIVWIIISAGLAVTVGLLLARGISVPVQRLVAGVRELARGNLAHRLELPERDEFGRLGRAFNDMATELAARDAEIRQWNEELLQRVNERTLAIEQYHSRLVHAEKASVIARLSAGVAAEVNDPLTGILGAVQLLSARVRGDPARADEARLFANAAEGAQRIRELIKRVQTLGQRQPRSQLRRVAVEDLVGSALGMLAPAMAAADVEVLRIRGDTVPRLLGNFTQLEQALHQLLTNALQSCRAAAHSTPGADLPNGSCASEQAPSKHRIIVFTTRIEPSMVLIAVTDDGVGIPVESLETIFEPFVTLRPDGGSGLGLTIARRIIEEHGGKLWAEANEVTGATLRMQLPSVDSDTPSNSHQAPVHDG
ncbi:MAG TPA: HAMP domain-containing sensor histidine kinase [Polyangiaceae bacterium]